MSAGAVAAALAVVFSSAMFLVYGTMLDTPVTSLPFAIAVVLVGQRVVDGRSPRSAVLAATALIAALSGWLALGFALAQAGRLAWRACRGTPSWRPAGALAGGAVLGSVITVAWCWWVYCSLDTLSDKADDKTSAVTLLESLTRQIGDARDLLPVAALVGGVGAVAALSDRRWRGALLSTLLPVLAYAIVFRGSAHMHDYWNYAVLAPLAIGAAAGAETVVRHLPDRHAMAPQLAIAATGALLAVVCSLGLSDGEAVFRNSLGTPALLDAAAEVAAPEGPVIAYLSPKAIESPWISYEARRPGLALHSPVQLSDLAERAPNFPVLVVWSSPSDAAADRLVEEAYAISGPYAVVPARTASAAVPPAS